MYTRSSRSSPTKTGFTLVELLAVVVVILVVTGLIIGIAGYVQKQMAIATTKSQIAAISLALESYKSDYGYYPPTTPIRISTDGLAEKANNALLYNALFNKGKRYLSLPAAQLHPDLNEAFTAVKVTNIFDVFGKPYNYYCSPKTPLGFGTRTGATIVVAGYGPYTPTHRLTSGGQVNPATFDLFSYGPDKITYYGTNIIFYANPSMVVRWNSTTSAVDDVTNWQR